MDSNLIISSIKFQFLSPSDSIVNSNNLNSRMHITFRLFFYLRNTLSTDHLKMHMLTTYMRGDLRDQQRDIFMVARFCTGEE